MKARRVQAIGGSQKYARMLTATQQKVKDKAQKAAEERQYRNLYRGLKWLYKASKGYEQHKPLDNYEQYELDRAVDLCWSQRQEVMDK